MANRRTKTICTFLINHGINPAKAPSLAEDLAERLKEQPPEWNWRELRTALRNPAFGAAIVGITLTAVSLYVTFDQTLLVQATPGAHPLPLIPGLVVIGWLVLPPLYFFIELYLRGTSKEERGRQRNASGSPWPRCSWRCMIWPSRYGERAVQRSHGSRSGTARMLRPGSVRGLRKGAR